MCHVAVTIIKTVATSAAKKALKEMANEKGERERDIEGEREL